MAHEITAYHEAGHAVMACMLNQPFKEVVVNGGGRVHGQVVFHKNQVMENPAYALMALLAGHLAERIYLGRPAKALDEMLKEPTTDMAEIREILDGAFPPERRRSAGQELYEIVCGMLELPPVWRCIDAVAGDLLSAGRASYEQVLERTRGIGEYLTGKFPG